MGVRSGEHVERRRCVVLGVDDDDLVRSIDGEAVQDVGDEIPLRVDDDRPAVRGDV